MGFNLLQVCCLLKHVKLVIPLVGLGTFASVLKSFKMVRHEPKPNVHKAAKSHNLR